MSTAGSWPVSRCHAFGGAEVGRDAGHLGVFVVLPDPPDGLLDPPRRATVDHDGGPLAGQQRGDGEADPGRRAGDQGRLAGQLQVHQFCPPS